MSSIHEVLAVSRISLIAVFSFVFFIKMILFFKYEKEWNSLTFFHFTKIQLKMTVSKELRKWRRRQNTLTNVILLLVLILAITSAFNLLIADSWSIIIPQQHYHLEQVQLVPIFKGCIFYNWFLFNQRFWNEDLSCILTCRSCDLKLSAARNDHVMKSRRWYCRRKSTGVFHPATFAFLFSTNMSTVQQLLYIALSYNRFL
jgi:hypothetical protein